MKKQLTRGISVALAISMLVTTMFVASGCGKEPEIEEDTVTTISVTSEELAPEITDEDLGITRKDPKELSKIVGYQSWEGYDFLIFRNEAGEGDTTTTVEIEDKDLFNSLYNARLYVYADVSYASVSQDDPMYMSYAKGLRSLGADFYTLADEDSQLALGEKVMDADQSSEPSETGVNEPDTEEPGQMEVDESDSGSDNAEDTVTDSEQASTDSSDQNEEIAQDDADVSEQDTSSAEVPTEEDLDGTGIEVMTNEDFENGGWQDTEASIRAEKANNELQEAIDAYMSSVSLNRATQILVFALDGELLGEMTSAKLDDYVAAFDIVPVPYSATELGVAYISDMNDGVTYKMEGNPVDEMGTTEYTIKNDTKRPVVIYTTSETTQDTSVIFENYMQTKKSQGWYLVENQYEFTSSDPSYNIRIEHKNSDADLAASLPEAQVLTVTDLQQRVVTVPSAYVAIVNDTDETLYVVADTGDTAEIGSKQAIGVHRSAYGSLSYYFEGAEGVDDLLYGN